jgi:hypothetical protein
MALVTLRGPCISIEVGDGDNLLRFNLLQLRHLSNQCTQMDNNNVLPSVAKKDREVDRNENEEKVGPRESQGTDEADEEDPCIGQSNDGPRDQNLYSQLVNQSCFSGP